MALSLIKSFLKGLLAGLAIACGSLLYILAIHFIPGELGKIVGALLFPIGLTIVCLFALHLYTGKIGLVFEKKHDLEFYISLPVMLAGNLVAAVAIGYLCFLIFKDLEIMNTVAKVAEARTTLNSADDYLSLIFKGLLCGLFVYLAVRSYAFFKNKVIGIVLVFVFIFTFVYLGCQHCIANMFYLGFANAYDDYHAYINLAICILANSLGTIPGVMLFKLFKNENQ